MGSLTLLGATFAFGTLAVVLLMAMISVTFYGRKAWSVAATGVSWVVVTGWFYPLTPLQSLTQGAASPPLATLQVILFFLFLLSVLWVDIRQGVKGPEMFRVLAYLFDVDRLKTRYGRYAWMKQISTYLGWGGLIGGLAGLIQLGYFYTSGVPTLVVGVLTTLVGLLCLFLGYLASHEAERRLQRQIEAP